MDTLNALRNLMENPKQDKKEDPALEKEKSFFRAAAACLNPQAGKSAIMGYDPQKMLEFLHLPLGQIKEKLGGEWTAMSDSDLESFLYGIEKKVKKSASMMDWSN